MWQPTHTQLSKQIDDYDKLGRLKVITFMIFSLLNDGWPKFQNLLDVPETTNTIWKIKHTLYLQQYLFILYNIKYILHNFFYGQYFNLQIILLFPICNYQFYDLTITNTIF